MSDLTAKEQENVRAALRFLRLRCGTWKVAGNALHIDGKTLARVARGAYAVSASLAMRTARFAKVGVDDVLGGRFPPPGTCPHCGSTVGATRDGAKT